MQRLNEGRPEAWWCPRCGTIKCGLLDPDENWSEPKLVKRAFDLCEASLDAIAEVTSYSDEANDSTAIDKLECQEESVRECVLPPEER
jgi:hypothetical protein